jgi:glycosyltransferase involved in cell wall biosynthesis
MNPDCQTSFPRVLHVTSALDPGGIETWLSRLIECPDGARLVGGVVVLSEREGLLAPRFRDRGIPLFCLPVRSGPAGFVRSVTRLLRQTGPWDIVHSHVHRRSALVHCGALLAGVPVRISHSHNTKGQEPGSPPLPHRVAKSAATWVIHHLSSVRLACSEAAAAALYGPGNPCLPTAALPAHGIPFTGPGRPIICMPYGMDVKAFLRQAALPVSRSALGIPPGARVVGHVGRFMEQKNHRFLLEVAAAALQRDPSLHFLLVGDGPLRPDMEALAASLGIARHVTFTGNRLDVPALMSQCMDCYFFPSLWEGLGIVLLEAQAAGLPCVLSDVVPREANRLPERNRLFSLDASPESVAAVLLQALPQDDDAAGPHPHPDTFLDSIAGNTRALAQVYLESFACHAARSAAPGHRTVWSSR